MRFVKAAVVAAGINVSILAAAVPPVFEASTVSQASTVSAASQESSARLTSMAVAVPSGRVIPNPSAPGTPTRFDVFCGQDAKSATLFGQSLGLAELILMQSTSRPGEFFVTVTLPASIAPGRYHPSFDCSNGNIGKVSFSVNPVPHQAPETGDGTTATETGTPLSSIGYGLMGLGAIAGVGAIALRRRVAHRS
ncbi:MAG TPA: hypothetical protein VEV63_07940 [Streptosporangiaceae bacterium]|nr:hypothetical protein [Streptosporangiaceae bacterium]